MSNLAFATIVHLLLAALPFGTTTPTPGGCEQPYYQYNNTFQGSYIVNFTDGYTLQQHFNTLGHAFNVTQLDTGYFANLTTGLLNKVRTDCGVQFVEDNGSGLTAEEDDALLGNSSQTSSLPARRGTQKNGPWSLVNLSASQKNPTDQTYYYVDNPGQGVDVYIFDSGINHPQDEFNDDDGNDRVIDEINFSTDSDYTDTCPNAGHGTRVASAIGGNGYGVAKGATLRNVKFERRGRPDAGRFVLAMEEVISRHNSRKTQPGFKGSIVNMSFTMTKTRDTDEALDKAYDAGISLVGAAGNFGYNPKHYPSTYPRVISVAGSNRDYIPWQSVGSVSNYGETSVTLWAPGQRAPLCNKAGNMAFSTGTSFAAGYVSGTLAIFYGVEGTDMDPSLARTRLMAQTDDWIDLPDDGTDWHNSPTALVNTGNLKGATQDPPVQYIGGPQVAAVSATNTSANATATATATPSVTPTQGCQSSDHDIPLTSFTLAQGEFALSDFISQCQGVELQPDGPAACTLYYNPCSQQYGAKAVDVIMTVWQSEWASGVTSTFPDVQEMDDAVSWIMNSCDTTTTTAKWGGYQSVSVSSGMRMYNVSANQDGQYPTPPSFDTVTVTTTSGGENCAAWDST